MTHEELVAYKADKERAKKRAARKAENPDRVLKDRKGEPKIMTEALANKLEKAETRKKNEEHKKVREAKMREWNGDVQGDDSVPTGKKMGDVPENAILVFKMKHKVK